MSAAPAVGNKKNPKYSYIQSLNSNSRNDLQESGMKYSEKGGSYSQAFETYG